ncbi:MAG TPA: helix-turn-helix domain-containing protein [Streptosporangiaceae bacterium]|nr:helix-turn-helix domain-containing protein [Streptosporangiaceae bacterium]
MAGEVTRRKELHDSLKAARARVQPKELGLTPPRNRRSGGLHQADVAAALNVSQRWYNGFENGSTVPGDDLLDQLARVLRLTHAERVHLYLLATGHEPAPGTVEAPYHGETVLSRLVHFLDDPDIPAVVTDIAWNVLSWNRALSAWIPDPGSTPPAARNAVLWTFASEVERVVDDIHSFREAFIGRVHLALARHPGEPRLEHLVARLQRIPDASELWDRQHIADFISSITPVRLRLPDSGTTVDADLLSTEFPGEYHLLMLVPRSGWPAQPPTRSRLTLRRNNASRN